MIVRSKDSRYYIVGPELVATEAYHSLRHGATREAVLAASGKTRWLALRIMTTAQAAWTAYNVANVRAKEMVLADQEKSRQKQAEVSGAESLGDLLDAALR